MIESCLFSPRQCYCPHLMASFWKASEVQPNDSVESRVRTSKAEPNSHPLLKIVHLQRQLESEYGAVDGFVIQAGFAWKNSAAGKNVLDGNPSGREAARRGRQRGSACAEPAPAAAAQPGKGASRNCRHRSLKPELPFCSLV